MKPEPATGRWLLTPALLLAAAIWVAPWDGYSATNEPAAGEIRIVELQGRAEVLPAGAATWVFTQTNQVLHPLDRLRVGRNSRAALRWSDQSVVAFGALTELEILPPHASDAQSGLHLLKGLLSFFHRDKPGRIRVITRGAVAGVEGTEFVMSVEQLNGSEHTTLSVIDGKVRFSNELDALSLTNDEQAIAKTGEAPRRTAGFIANNVLQWCFYYPAALDPGDLLLTPEEQNILGESLEAYRAGDLLAALDKYPASRQPGSDAERIYHAALLLSVGQVQQTEDALALLPAAEPTERHPRLANALRQLIAAVKRETRSATLSPQLSTEFLAASYYEQSRGGGEDSLRTALGLARQAATDSPEFSFAWERVAELEFSFGHTDRALDALTRSLALAPRNAQALALKGFLLAAQNHTREAIVWFDLALAADPALGNAWLGRGLCRIRRGDTSGGREDLLVAAALEPQRAGLRSYLGKAYADTGDGPRAAKELQLAKEMDTKDPTAWLYSALLKQQQNRINEGIGDLEKSQELNENRRLYRSRLLLDEDRAVRSANLAGLYRDAGMSDVSVREAVRAVNADYGNYSAHLFLADSFNELRDPNGINLRYETPALSEYLLANLLAPVGAGTLSPTLSQQEYSKLFERDRFGFYSDTEYLSRGAWTQGGAQFGTFGNFSYNFEALYHTDPGQRPNNDSEARQFSLQIKQQLTPQDSVYLQGVLSDASGGDLIQYYDPASANPGLRTHEKQEPIISLGYHREWGPGVHTLLLGSRLHDRISVNNPAQVTFFVDRTPDGLDYVEAMTINQTYRSTLEIYSAEVQQLWQTSSHNTIFGMRFQAGDFDTQNRQTDPSLNVVGFFDPSGSAADQDFTTDFQRLSFYAYHHWKIVDALLLIGGLSYDRVDFPENFRAAPITNRRESVDRVSPKAGLIWTPARNTTVRAAYTRSLAGASIDQSLQLEPSQVAGFNQSFRSIIPESVGGAEAGARFETYGLSVEEKLPSRTYLGLSAEQLNSEVDPTFGVFEADFSGFARPGATREHIRYRERALLVTVDQLVGDEWSVGARYRLSRADLTDDFPEVLAGAAVPPFESVQHLQATLHQLNLYTIYNHRSGFFAGFHALWNGQSNQGYSPDIPGDDFWQFNVLAGYRSPRRRAELTLGLLNLAGQNYRLNPLTLQNELPRERTFALRLRLSF